MIPKNKAELQTEIKTHFLKLFSELEDFPVQYADKKELEWQRKGTLVSVNDLLAYLIGWWNLVLKWEKFFENIDEIDLPETGYKWNELGKLAEKFYEDYSQYSFFERKILLQQNSEKILERLQKYDDIALYTNTWYGKWTFGRMIQFNTSSPYKNIRARIRKYKKSLNIIS